MTHASSQPAALAGAGSPNAMRFFNIAFALLTFAALAFYTSDAIDPNDMRWLVIAGLAGLSLVQLGARALALGRIALDWQELSLLGFAAYATLSLAWTPDPLAGYAMLAKMGLLLAVFLCVKNAGNAAWFKWMCFAVAASAAVVLALQATGAAGAVAYAGYGNRNFLVEYLVLATPFIVTLAFVHPHKAVQGSVVALILVMYAYMILFNESKIEYLVAAGLSCAALVAWGWKRSHWGAIGGAVAVVAVTLAAVAHFWDASHGFRESIYPRLSLLVNSLLMWLDKPFFGQGVNSFNYMYSFFQERHLEWLNVASDMFYDKKTIAGATHNEYIETLATFGLAGMALLVVFARFLLAGLKGRAMTPYAWCGVAATGVWMLNALVEFPLQNPGTALLAAIGLGFAANGGGPDAAEAGDDKNVARRAVFTLRLNQATRALPLAAALAACALLAYGAARFRAADQDFFQAMNMLNTQPERAFELNEAAYREYPWDNMVRSQLYVTTTRWFELRGKPPLPPQELDRLFDISVAAMPSTQLLLARLQYLLNSRIYKTDPRYVDEMQKWFAVLRRDASHTPDVHILDAYYRLMQGDLAGAANELDAAQRLGGNGGTIAMIRGALAEAQAAQAQKAAQPGGKNP